MFEMSSFCLHASPEALAMILAYHRDVLLAQNLLPVNSSNVCLMGGRNEIRINEDQM